MVLPPSPDVPLSAVSVVISLLAVIFTEPRISSSLNLFSPLRSTPTLSVGFAPVKVIVPPVAVNPYVVPLFALLFVQFPVTVKSCEVVATAFIVMFFTSTGALKARVPAVIETLSVEVNFPLSATSPLALIVPEGIEIVPGVAFVLPKVISEA